MSTSAEAADGGMPPASASMKIHPEPSAEEVAAIVAALAVAEAPAAPPVPEPTVPVWRFSGRWWRVAPRSWPYGAFPDRVRPR